MVDETKIIILGSGGMLGSHLTHVFPKALAATHQELDITDVNKVKSYINEHCPELVINAAAYTNVEGSEKNKYLAFNVNAESVKHLVKACSEVNAALVHYSTDYVFDGTKKGGYAEGDAPKPINTYGLSKLAGENYIKELKKHYLIRTSWIFNETGNNFILKILDKALKGNELSVVSEEYGKPTYAKDLAVKTKEVINLPYGTYHVTNSGSCSRYELACEALKIKKLNNKVIPVKTYPSLAKRPKFSILLNNNLKKQKIKKLRDWRIALRECLMK